MNYSENSDFDINNSEELKMGFETSIERSTKSPEALVKLTMNLGDKENAPFFMSVVMSAMFFWDEGIGDDIVKDLLEKNAVSLLISYIRPIVANITSSTRYPTFNLPFINVSGD